MVLSKIEIESDISCSVIHKYWQPGDLSLLIKRPMTFCPCFTAGLAFQYLEEEFTK